MDDDDLGKLLKADLLDVPQEFTQRVMAKVRTTPAPELKAPRRSAAWSARLRWIALAGGALWGAPQLAGFIFGMWSAMNAG